MDAPGQLGRNPEKVARASKESSPLWTISQATISFAKIHALLALLDYYNRDTYAPCRCSPPLQVITLQTS
jgi:hypothetical protein